MEGIDFGAFERFSILFVEDEKDFVSIIRSFLSDIFGKVEVAYDGVEGLGKALEADYDIIVTDITMPNMNGFDMIEKIKEVRPEQKTIVLSAHKEDDFMNRAQQLKVDEFLHKPIGVDVLLKGLYQVLLAK